MDHSKLDWYANVPGSRRNIVWEMPVEHPLYNTTLNYQIYNSMPSILMRNRPNRSNDYVNADVASGPGPSYSNVDCPIYDYVDLNETVILHTRSPTSLYSSVGYLSSGYSSITELVNLETNIEYFDVSAPRSRVTSATRIYESVHQPMYPSRSASRSTSNNRHNVEVHSLSDMMFNSMPLNNVRRRKPIKPRLLNYRCGLCGKISLTKDLVYTQKGSLVHMDCLACTHCKESLRGKSFYYINEKPFCDMCYLEGLYRCSVCKIPILDRILTAAGRKFHHNCFRCVVCSKLLNGIRFTVDTENQIYCINDYHKKFAPKCGTCKLPIAAKTGEGEVIRYVLLDKSFHTECCRCEDCHVLLGKEPGRKTCYPLDDHLLCKNCNAIRIQVLTAKLT